MTIDIMVLNTLAEPQVRSLFEQILKGRSIRFGELMHKMNQIWKEAPLTPDAVSGDLQRLKNAGLIADKRSPIEEWSIYYVTAGGLEAGRKFGI